MSVLVKGMEMPENCIRCPMQFGGWCYVAPAEIDERVAPTVDEAWEQGKPDWCPLVEVPTPHRRLVDADDLMRIIEEHQYLLVDYINSKDYGMFTNGIQQAVDETPTVIEAEE